MNRVEVRERFASLAAEPPNAGAGPLIPTVGRGAGDPERAADGVTGAADRCSDSPRRTVDDVFDRVFDGVRDTGDETAALDW